MIPIMLSEDELREKLRDAFLLGFSISREGFNAERSFDHLAPSEIEGLHEPLSDFSAHIRCEDTFLKLREGAVDSIMATIAQESE